MKIITDEKTRCVKPIGRLDATNSNELDLALMALPENGQDVIVDLSECPYVSSAGIRILLKATKRLRSGHHELFIAGVVPEVFQVFEIAGLHRVLRFEASVGNSLAIIQSAQKSKTVARDIYAGNHQLAYQPTGEDKITGQFCLSTEILSYHELGYTLGFGSLSENPATDKDVTDLFVSVENCCGFIPLDPSTDPDFRIASDPVKTGLSVCEALSFGHQPTGSLKLATPDKLTFGQLKNVIHELKETVFSKNSIFLLVMANRVANNPSLSLALTHDANLDEIVKKNGLDNFQQVLAGNAGNSERKDFIGITFLLSELDISVKENSLPATIRQHLNFENIVAVHPLNTDTFLENPIVWLFRANDFVDGKTTRLIIETKPESVFEPHQAFLARQLYTDSSKLLIDQLHGGYSAQTFHVTSFDHEGRKMRPTVLKISNRALITRESERCKQFALPYIFNNSAVVLGAEFHGETGALRYNFVGIGGESSQLKWLTHYYHDSEFSFLEPLFDKIFLHILKPWYGQPVAKTIFPFKDHDPTFTFFPHIYKVVDELFSISPDEKYIRIQEQDQPILNPYWFLKHEFARRRDWGMEYFTGICHGDLNMQNILLDENMNVYLIDFSETKPRSVISDFARLEAIFLIDNASLEDETDRADYLNFIRDFYKSRQLDELPEINYTGKHSEKVNKNAALALKMRKYAFDSTRGNPNPVPYHLALLEWVLPIVCYYSLPLAHKRLAMIVSSILCEKLMAEEPK